MRLGPATDHRPILWGSGSLNWERTTNAETFDVELGAFEIRMKEVRSPIQRDSEAPFSTGLFKEYKASSKGAQREQANVSPI